MTKLPRKMRIKLAVWLLLTLCAGYAIFIEPTWLKVERVDLTLPHLPRAFDGYRVVQLTDLHYPRSLGQRYFRRIVTTANAQHPDLILMTGDYICVDSRDAEGAAALLAGLHAPDGVIGILGNHDFWTSPAYMARCLRARDITVLCNQATALTRDKARLWIVGVDDYWQQHDDLAQALRGVPAESAKILLVHEPDFAPRAARQGIDLQLSGHSHGGLVWFPGLGAPRLPPFARRYPRGLYTVDGMRLYTNRGLGVIPLFNIPFRFNCRPEITVITLHAPPAHP